MGPVGKTIVGSLAVLGGVVVLGTLFAPAVSIALYSPYMPKQDLLKVRGSTLLKLLTQGGGSTQPQSTSGMPFPIGIRVRLFDTSTSVGEEAYESITGKTFDMRSIL
jgi:hypothetical protein